MSAQNQLCQTLTHTTGKIRSMCWLWYWWLHFFFGCIVLQILHIGSMRVSVWKWQNFPLPKFGREQLRIRIHHYIFTCSNLGECYLEPPWLRRGCSAYQVDCSQLLVHIFSCMRLIESTTIVPRKRTALLYYRPLLLHYLSLWVRSRCPGLFRSACMHQALHWLPYQAGF